MGVLDKMKPESLMLPSKVWRSAENRKRYVPPRSLDPISPIWNAPALESALDARGHQRFHARQIFRWIYQRGVTDIDGDDRPARAICARRSRTSSR